MIRDKTPNDIRGKQINCPNLIQCPFCFGCRNYNSSDSECQICLEENKKVNICDTSKHKPNLIAKMITKSVIKINNKGDNK